MKIISITELTDTQWQLYFELGQNIFRKYYPDFYKPDDTLIGYKKEILKHHENQLIHGHKGYLILDEYMNQAIGWFDHTDFEEVLGWRFDVNMDIIDTEIMKMILSGILKAILDTGREISAHNWEFNERKKNAILGTGAEIYDEHFLWRLYREDMKIGFYRTLADKYKPGQEFRIEYFDHHPEELMSKLVKITNEMHNDILSLHPRKLKVREQTESDLRRYINNNSPKMNMIMIFDKDCDIAGLCNVFEEDFDGKMLRHGMTGVTQKYRGRGLGRFLKASLYTNVLEKNIDFKYIMTDTMPWNSYMRRINDELGFKIYKEGYEFRLTKEYLENFLNNTN